MTQSSATASAGTLARDVCSKLGGDPARIWSDHPTARQLQERLEAIVGIGQKKAAMAVEILERDLRVSVREMAGSDVAYDVHVRRVFMRTGLTTSDRLEEVLTAARRLCPERPGALDEPAWVVGRTWCRPGTPRCGSCPIVSACGRILFRS